MNIPPHTLFWKDIKVGQNDNAQICMLIKKMINKVKIYYMD